MRRALFVVLVLVLAGCGGDDDGNGSGNPQESDCVTQGSADLPELEEGKTYRLAFKTSEGNFTIGLDRDKAPCTSASFVGLTEKGFFNGLASCATYLEDGAPSVGELQGVQGLEG